MKWYRLAVVRGSALLTGVLAVIDQSAEQAARTEAAKQRIRHTIYALGGSDEQQEAAVDDAVARTQDSAVSQAFYSIDDAADDVLAPWLAGEGRQ